MQKSVDFLRGNMAVYSLPDSSERAGGRGGGGKGGREFHWGTT